MSEVLNLVLTIIGILAGCALMVFLTASTVLGCFLELSRWRREGMATKRLNVSIGQHLEIEYQLTPETKEVAADVEVSRVFAYSGAVRVDVMPLLNEAAHDLMARLVDRCRDAEGIATIAF